MRILQHNMLLIFMVFFTESFVFAADIEGSSDHPMVGRFSGSSILGYKYHKFNEYELPQGGMYQDENSKFRYAKSYMVEGAVTRIDYVAPKESSVAEVMRSYEKQLEKKGFATNYSCKGAGDYDDCGYWAKHMSNYKPALVGYAYNVGENRLTTMKKTDPKGDVYVSLLVFNYTFDYYANRYGHPVVQLDVIEAEALDDDQIEVITADKITTAVNEQGKIAIYGIYFDTDKSDLKAESKDSIDQIYQAMSNNPELKLHVVGHTDNTGGFGHNMQLSQARADSVVNALIELGIDKTRLKGNGVASLAPVASNQSEEGKAKNRRVELVAQ